MRLRKITISAAFLLFMVLASCSTLQPIFLPEEQTRSSENSAVWQAVERTYSGNWQVPLNDGQTALAWRLRAIDSASASIDLQTFLWSFDTVGNQVMSRLLVAADRGVEVKLLIDDTFLAGEEGVLLALQEHPNIKYRIYNPYKRRTSGSASRAILNLGEFGRLDHRMHNKSMIVDNKVAIVGGRNLADEYFGLDDQANFRDMELLLGGPIVEEISTSFDEYWNDRWSFPIQELSHVKTTMAERDRILASENDGLRYHDGSNETENQKVWREVTRTAFRGRPTLYADAPPLRNPAAASDQPVQVADELTRLFNAARSEIVIVSAYLIPTPVVTEALADAVERGVKVRILTNSIRSNNHLAAHSAYQNHVRELLTSGVALHEVRAEAKSRNRYILAPIQQKKLALHAKYLVIDRDLVFIGSANLDPRSLRINTEMGLLVRDRALNRKVRELSDPDFEQSNAWELNIDSEGKISWIGDDIVLETQPAASFMQRVEDWFFAHLPLEGEL